MTPKQHIVVLFVSILAVSKIGYCQVNVACQRKPEFIKQLGFNPQITAISTSEKHQIGLVLVELLGKSGVNQSVSEVKRGRDYQHPSWKSAGYLSGFVFDTKGNILLVPTPFISILYNEPLDQNKIYKVDHKSGIMSIWKSLPIAFKPTIQNPYGLVSISFSCFDTSIFVSTLMGSDRLNEKGIIYHISLNTGKVIDSIPGIDALSVTATVINGKQLLYFGEARSSKLKAVSVLPNGKFEIESIVEIVNLADLGLRGDDKIRKLKFVDNKMIATGLEFNFTLQAANELPESYYTFEWNKQSQKWNLIGIQ